MLGIQYPETLFFEVGFYHPRHTAVMRDRSPLLLDRKGMIGYDLIRTAS
jgi:hypothetical protein